MKQSVNGSIKVAYVLLHFPYHTETFIAEEIRAIKGQSVRTTILSLLGPGDGPVHPVSESLLDRVVYSPGFTSPKLWIAQGKHLLRQPAVYIRTLFTLLRCPHSQWLLTSLAKRLVIFLKAVATIDQIRELQVDVLHTHFAWLSGVGTWILAQFLALPFTMTVHAFDIFALTDFVQLLLAEAAGTIAISEYNRRYLSKLSVQLPGSISVIHCGVDLEQFTFLSPTDKANDGDRRIRILSVGSLVPKKGHESLIHACKLILEEDYVLECNIIGDGPLRDDLNRLIKSEGLQEHIHLVGSRSQSEIVKAYHQHDVFVLASVVDGIGDRDGIPVVLMEAGASGLPVISSNISGIPEIIRHGKTGLLVSAGDIPAIARSILEMHSDITRRVMIANNARQLIEQEFDVRKNSEQVVEFFAEIVSESKKRKYTD